MLSSVEPRYKLPDLERSEWDATFERYMRNRLIMGALRYGPLRLPGKPQYDRMASIEKRCTAYRQTGNLELLVDIANLCLVEFVEGNHPLRHWESLDGGHNYHAKAV